MRNALLWASGVLATVSGCSGCAESTTSHTGALELALRTGATCAEGCALDRGLIPGTEERIEVRATGEQDLSTLRVVSESPEIAAAWMERTTLCCSGATCEPVRHAAGCEGGRLEAAQSMVAVRALAPGRARLAFRLDDEPFDAVELEVAAPTDVVVERTLVDVGELPIDVILPPPLELPPLLLGEHLIDRLRTLGAPEPSTQGAITTLVLRADTTAVVRFEVHDVRGRTLHGREGVTATIVDPSVALLVPPGLRGSGGLTRTTGELGLVRGLRAGRTELVLRAGEVETRIAVEVDPSCRPAADVAMSGDACESDADCLPDACCHASACTHASKAPTCDDVACTLECRFGTLDCGGRCLCLAGRCAGFRSPTPDPTCPAPWTPARPTLPRLEIDSPLDEPVIEPVDPDVLTGDDDEPDLLPPTPPVIPGPHLPPGPRPTPD